MVWAWHEDAGGVYVFEWVGEWIGEALATAGGCVGESAAASAYVAGAGAVAAVSASDELEELEQTEPSFIQLFTFVMASVSLEGGWGSEAYEWSWTCGVTVICSGEWGSEVGERGSVTYVYVYEDEDVCDTVWWWGVWRWWWWWVTSAKRLCSAIGELVIHTDRSGKIQF